MLQGKTFDLTPIRIEIPASGVSLSVDFTNDRRGLWVNSGDAWYWLHDWHASQDTLHQAMRAKFGLLSNLIDTLLEGGYFENFHRELSPKLLHQKLSCLDEAAFQVFKQNRDDDDDTLIFQEPFDYTLLSEQGSISFIKQHLGGLYPGFDKSKFWKELVKLKGHKRGTPKWTSEQYRASAELAEERSQRMPWGVRLPNANETHFNWNVEARLDQERYEESPKAKRRRRVLEDSNEEEEPAKKKMKQKSVLDNDEDRLRQEVALDAQVMRKEAYSDERMVQALVSAVTVTESFDTHVLQNGALTSA